MSQKFSNFYIEWWTIQKSTVALIIGLPLLLIIFGVTGWYAWHSGWLVRATQSPTEAPNAARFQSVEGDVRVVRAKTRETVIAGNETILFAGDTVQTQADGKARIILIDGSTLSIRPNSTVVIRDNTLFGTGTNVRVALGGGQINVRTEKQNENTQNIVEVRQTENKLTSETDASFGINPTTNNEEIRIARGVVETNANGQNSVLKSGEFATVNNGSLSKEKLMDPPILISPEALTKFTINQNDSSKINLSWNPPRNLPPFTYRVEVAKSPFFVQNALIFEREPVRSQSLSVSNLGPGTYFWRVRATASSGQISEWSEPYKFVVAVRNAGGKLEVTDWNVEYIGGNIYLISGKTLPGATVHCVGREIIASNDGSFRLQIPAPSDTVVVEVEEINSTTGSYSLNLSTSKVVSRN
jgi:hypothetical protein